MKQFKPTLANIAARTGYGTNTVSLALRGSTRISKEAREVIQATARELDYVPNAIAKSLVLKRSNTVGLILHDITNPLVTNAAKTIQLTLSRRGYGVMFATSNGSFEEENRAIEMFRSRMIDGLLIYPTDHSRLDHLIGLRGRNFPVVLLIGTDRVEIDAVGIDEFKGAFDATAHLIGLGHARVGALVDAGGINPEKLNGYRDAMRGHGLDPDDALIASPAAHSIAAGVEAMGRLMAAKPTPTAVFAGSDLFALSALRWATVNGVGVPEGLAIVGFDDTEYAEQAVVEISSIRNDVESLSSLAVERLMTLIACDGQLPPPTSRLIEGALVERESSARRFDRQPAAPE